MISRPHLITAAVVVALALLAVFAFHVAAFTVFGLVAIAAVFYFIALGWSKSRRP